MRSEYAGAAELKQRLSLRSIRALTNANVDGNRLCNQVRGGQRCEIDEPDAIGELIDQLGCQSHRQAGLANPTRSNQRHEA